MDNSNGALHFEATLNYQQLREGADAIRREIMGLNNTVQQQTSSMQGAFKNLAIGMSSYFSAQALMGFTRELINVRGEFQKTEIAFGTMLGSTEKAKALMGDMVNLAAKTPFSLQEVSAGAKQLLAFQVPANQVVDTLTRMGNIAAGLSVPLERVNLVYGQVKAKGRLQGDDLRQFTEMGIPMIHELAENMKVADSAITKMVTDGKIGFSDVQKVLFNMTNQGGMFYNLMQKQSESLSGKVSNLGDAFSQMLNKIGESNQGLLSGGIDMLSNLVAHYEDVINVIATLVSAYGTYKAALIAANLINESSIFLEGAKAAIEFAQGISGIAKAQLLLNLAMEANPVMVMATALAAVVAAIVYFKTESEEAKNATQEMAEAVNAATAAAGKESTELNSLYASATNENKSRKERIDAVNQLQKLYPSYFGNLSTEIIMAGKASQQYNELRDAIIASARARAIESELQKRESDRLARDAKTQSEMDTVLKRYKENGYKDTDINLGTGTGSTYTSTAGQQKKNDQLTYYKLLQEKNKNRQKDLAEDKYYIDAKESLNKKAEKYNKDTAAREAGTDSTKPAKEPKKKVKKPHEDKPDELAEVVSNDSIIALERRVENWNAALQRMHDGKVDVLTQDKTGKQVKTGETISLEDAKNRMREDQAKLDKARKEIKLQSFDEELAETKRQTEVRDKLLQSGYSKETVDKMFPKIAGKSYIQSLEETQSSLQKLMNSGKGGEETANNLYKIQEAIREFKGQKSFIEGINDDISSLKETLSGNELIAKMEGMKKLNINETEEQHQQKVNLYQKAIDDEKKAQEKKYQDILKEQQTYQEKSAALQKEFETTKSTEGYQNATPEQRKKIDEHYHQQATDLFFNSMSKDEKWNAVFTDMNKVATTKLVEFKEILKKQLTDAKTIEEKVKIGEFIQKIDGVLGTRNPFGIIADGLADYRKALNDSRESQEKYDKAVAESGKDSSAAKAALDALDAAQQKAAESKKALAGEITAGAQKSLDFIGEARGVITDVRGAFDDLGLSLNNGFGDFLSKLDGYMQGAQQSMEGVKMAAEGVISGNPVAVVAGVVKSIAGTIKSISSLFNNDGKKERTIKNEAAAVSELKIQYEALDKAISKALGDDKYKAQENVIANLKQQAAAVQKMLDTEKSKKKGDQSKINDYQSQLQSINQQIEDIQNNIVKNVLQTDATDAAGKLGDALVNAFSKGEDASKAMRDTANSMIQDIVKNALKMRMEQAMKPVLDNLLTQVGFNSDGTGSFKGLSPDQIENFKAQIATIGSQQQGFLDAYSALFKDTATDAQGLKADIKGVTEQTAGALEGQINAMRINQASGLEAMRSSLLQLSMIEVNTRPITQISKDISELNTKFSKNGLKAIGIG